MAGKWLFCRSRTGEADGVATNGTGTGGIATPLPSFRAAHVDLPETEFIEVHTLQTADAITKQTLDNPAVLKWPYELHESKAQWWTMR